MSTINPKTAPAAIRDWLAEAQVVVDASLDRVLRLPDLAAPDSGLADPVVRLAEAMRYAVLGKGKRLRPALVLAACEACGGRPESALPAATAIEILHAYTLVHDDLPAMDDDDERRGRPSVHIQYDEATAILVGDGLLTVAFETLASLESGAARAVALLARRAGPRELLGGQMLDLRWQQANHQPNVTELERLHAGKTGALFSAACELGAIAAGADPARQASMGRYGMDVGVAFQHADDLDDGDFAEHAVTAKARRAELSAKAITELADLGDAATLLRDFAAWIGQATISS